MTTPRTLEEIAYATFPEADHRAERCLAALREAADAARQKEREQMRIYLMAMDHPADAALAWLDARSRAKEPKP